MRPIDRDLEVARNHGLATSKEGSVLRAIGMLGFKAHYSCEQLWYGESIPVLVRPELIIEDSWDVSITVTYGDKYYTPVVFDTSGRIETTMNERSLDLLHMHLNGIGEMPAGSFCVAQKFVLEARYSSGFQLEHYLKHYLVPFLFQQSYFERNHKWPWQNYAHGPAGNEGALEYTEVA